MGDVLVRKSIMNVISSRGPEIMYNLDPTGEVPYLPGQSQMSQMTQTPPDASGNFQYQAPKLDDAGSRRLADIYGTTGMNQRMDLDNAPNTEEGNRTALAQQKVFETAGRAGEAAHRKRDADANALGFLAGVIGLANAGAAGQDAFSGGLGAAGQYQATSQQVQQTSGRAGERAARRAANKVGVTQPQVAEPTPQVAPPTRQPVMVEGLDGNLVPIDSEEARNRALRDTYNPSDAAQALGHYGADAESRLQQTQQDATNLIGVTDNPLQMPLSPMRGDGRFRVIGEDGVEQTPAAPVAVASPTPEMSPEQIGETIAANTTGKTEEEELDSGAGNTIQQSLEQAQKAQEKAANASMSSASMTNKDDKRKMLVGVV
tara:strand:- start:19911 stop:21032 length:1122 start_codon:yes stop_codon:yes gene_type:complete